ncbi:hypothetical protein B0H17DRAFT_1149672 [Mycena rosella]|uniref:Uncharacterized protein n=1 Tax=Mycena rosella TaxID=1033263 RepID=A0AAD7C0D6_MYCRO|nr:hypothetical protein B0H17DRAFT_1149672 [Mycena rosella]
MPTMMSPVPNAPMTTSRGRRQKRGSGKQVQRQDSVMVWMERKMEVDGAWNSRKRCRGEGWRGGQRGWKREEERAVEVRMEEGEWKQVFGERGKMKKKYEAQKEKQRESTRDEWRLTSQHSRPCSAQTTCPHLSPLPSPPAPSGACQAALLARRETKRGGVRAPRGQRAFEAGNVGLDALGLEEKEGVSVG